MASWLKWQPTSGRAHTSTSRLRFPLTFNLDNISRSKRWVIDRATLKQARAEDLRYVDCPEHIDFLNIYFANRRMFPSSTPSILANA
jgi:hypothetical protein